MGASRQEVAWGGGPEQRESAALPAVRESREADGKEKIDLFAISKNSRDPNVNKQ